MKKEKSKKQKTKRPNRLLVHKGKNRQSPSQAGAAFLQNLLQQALALHQGGRLPEAEALYRQILQVQPDHVMALHFLGILVFEAGKFEVAAELMRRVVSLKPDFSEARYNLGNALVGQGKLEEALTSYRQALVLTPDYTEAHYNLGLLLQKLGKPEEAATSYRRALALKPDYLQALNNLGTTLKELGKLEEAIIYYRRVLALRPDYAEAHNNLGVILTEQGKPDKAIDFFRRALALKPDYLQALNNLGTALKDLGKLDEAITYYRRVLALKPDYAEAHNNLGMTFEILGKPEEAISCYHQALSLKPDFSMPHNNLGNILLRQGNLNEAIASYRRALAIEPNYLTAYSNLLFSLNYLPGQSIADYLEEARHYGRRASAKVGEHFSNWTCPTNPEQLRVGLVSGDFRQHPVGYFLENLLANLDSKQFRLTAYSTYPCEDELTARIRSRFFDWKPLMGMKDGTAARMIHGDGIHILIDLAGHTSHNRLPIFAWKPAPVQVSWLGYFASTGLKEMDYLLADPFSVPKSDLEQFTERIWYLPETRICFSPPTIDREMPLTPLPALHNGYITFGCFQNLAKLNDAVLTVWGKIFQSLPQARLRLQNLLFTSPAMREQIQRRLQLRGIAPERVSFAKNAPRKDYLAAHSHIDIILDTFPFPGGTTTCEALWMGVPTLTLAGKTMLGRQGASLLVNAGLPDWIAVDEKDYVAKAVAFASDVQAMAALRAGLRQQVLASPLFDGARFARNFEAALWGMWKAARKIVQIDE